MSNERFEELEERAQNELGLELIEKKIIVGTTTTYYHLREDWRSKPWPSFATLDEVENYLDTVGR